MTTFRGVRALAAAAILLFALTSCSDDADEPEAAPPPTPTSQSPSATPSDEPSLSPSEKAAQDAAAVVRKHFAAIDQARQDGEVSASTLEAGASSTELLVQKNMLKSQRKAGNVQLGDTSLVEVTVESVSLDNPGTAIVDVCWNVSAVDVVGPDGKSVVTPDRKDVGWTRLTVTNLKWKKLPADGWRVSAGRDLEKAPCVAS